MPDTIHIRIKKGYAAELIEDLIKANAVEAVEDDIVELTAAQKAALDKELVSIEQNPDYLLKWDDVKQKLTKG
jgi:hypothetical protein